MPINARRRTRPAHLYLPFVFSAALFALYFFIKLHPLVWNRFDVREMIFGKSLRGLLFVAIIPLILFLARVLDRVAFDVALSKRRAAPQLLRQIVSIVIYVLLFTWTLSAVFGYRIATLLTSATVVAAVVGLALQETLGNLFSGIALHLEDSFDVGDVIHSGEFFGVVEGVSWRATKLRAFNNQLVIVPNSIMARERIEVFPKQNLNGRVLQIGIDYHVPPATAIDVLTQAVAHIDGIARDLPCLARVGGFTDSAVNYEVKYYTRDYAMRDRIDADIRKAVWYALRRNEIQFATPIRAYQPYTPPKADVPIAVDEILSRLEGVDLLSPLSTIAHESLAGRAKVHVYSKGETILRHGTRGESMFVVHRGSVSVRVPDDDATGGLHEVAELGPGAIFGEMALLTGETRTADVVAVSDVTAFEITKEALQPILRDHPDLAEAISAKVTERRGRLASLLAGSAEEEPTSVLSRIRTFFGL